MSFSLKFAEDDVKVLASETAYQGFFTISKEVLSHRLFEGGWSEPLTREVFQRGDAVGVLPFDIQRDELILVEQFRPGARRKGQSAWMLELVAGVVDPGESDEQVAKREAEEEAGCVIDRLVPVANYFPSAGACSEQVRLFCGRVCSHSAGAVMGLETEGENILVHALPRAEVLQLLAAGKINNGHTLIVLQWLALNGETLRRQWLSQE
ncbi:MAG: ADP-ribose diphosphatase [Gammaproteobacteria bacterium]|nr:MAG: ADP-ribose diphosphatase [Gammaproteobacteria bacterium]